MLICMSYFIEVYTKSEYNIMNFKMYVYVPDIKYLFHKEVHAK